MALEDSSSWRSMDDAICQVTIVKAGGLELYGRSFCGLRSSSDPYVQDGKQLDDNVSESHKHSAKWLSTCPT